jgi:predicted nucleic acid-binding protein
MVFVYALLGVREFRDQAVNVLASAESIQVPDSFRAELVNVVWQWIQYQNVPLETGLEVLQDANSLIDQAISSDLLWERALKLAVENFHTAYDTLFIAAAENMKTRLITFDKKLLEIFPEWTLDANKFQ